MLKRIAGFVGGVAVIATISLLFHAGPAIAETAKELLVRNIDDPGRNHYQDAGTWSHPPERKSSSTFRTVPKGKRLIVTKVSATVSQVISSPGCLLFSDQEGEPTTSLPVTPPNGDETGSVINADANQAFEAGSTPQFACPVDNWTVVNDEPVSIFGYLIDEPTNH